MLKLSVSYLVKDEWLIIIIKKSLPSSSPYNFSDNFILQIKYNYLNRGFYGNIKQFYKNQMDLFHFNSIFSL